MSESERRVDPFTGRALLVAPGRKNIGGARPGGLPQPAGRCPFCPGHEADSEATVLQWPESGPWAARVVANKYPAVDAHEVVIESPDHDADLADYEIPHLRGVLGLWRERVRALEAEPATAAALVFRNRGRRAGSSQPHPHTQIAATSWVPAEVRLRWRIAQDQERELGRSLHAAVLERELASSRVLSSDPRVVSFCPYAPSRPFELRFAPREARGGFATAEDSDLDSLAAQLRDAALRLRVHTGIEDYNLVMRQPPARERGPAAAWHLELLPRTGGDAGFELATGEMIVVVAPEVAAAQLMRPLA